ncbi:MAG: CBS domain-containing protein [Deltaproteobacteria bacterium]|nr:CBS domain-containing protein [Deltaproteobacteria bacterium]
MKVLEFMTSKVEYVSAEATVYDAIEKMVDLGIRSLLVRFSANDKDDGVITARDVVFKVLAKNKDPKDVQVSQIASKPIICVDPEVDIIEASARMEASNITRVFVSKRDKIIGFVSLMDIMAAKLIMRARGENVSV